MDFVAEQGQSRQYGDIWSFMGFSIMYGCERWTIRKAECQRIDAFEL